MPPQPGSFTVPKHRRKGRWGTKRDDIARKALAMMRAGKTYADIEAEFDIADTTARNLVSRGAYLEASS